MTYSYSTSRTLRSSSAAPDSLHRLQTFSTDPWVHRALSVARETIDEELPSIKSRGFSDYGETKSRLDDIKEAFRRSDDSWLTRYVDAVVRGSRPSWRYYPSSSYNYRLYPSDYWTSPLSSLPPFSSYGKRDYPLNDYLRDSYGSDPYYGHWYSHRGPFMRYRDDWRMQYPYTNSYYSSYRPRYGRRRYHY